MRSCSSRPTGSSTNAVTTAVSSPKQRFSPRATLYSPPPSHTSKLRAVAIRRSPGSNRTITSPRLTRSQRQSFFGLIVSAIHSPQLQNLPSTSVSLSLASFTRFSLVLALEPEHESPPAPKGMRSPKRRKGSYSFLCIAARVQRPLRRASPRSPLPCPRFLSPSPRPALETCQRLLCRGWRKTPDGRLLPGQ